MRAAAFSTFGGPEVVSVIETATPVPGDGEVRIRVAAAPIQPADVNVRAGRFGPMIPAGPEYVLGWDVAGTIDATGAGVSSWTVGDDVIGLSQWLSTRVGTHAEYVVLPVDAIVPAPAGMSAELASTLPANALTALQALDQANLSAGQTLAVTGAGGAVGGYAVELARLRGVTVVGIASEQDERFLTERGAVFVPRSDDPVAAVRTVVPEGVDALLDAASLGAAAIGAVRDGGTFVAVIPPATPVPERGIDVQRAFLQGDRVALGELVRLAENGQLTPRVGATFPLEDAADAHALFEKGGLRGRVVLVP